MRFRIARLVPLGRPDHHFRKTKAEAFELARSFISSRVLVYEAGRLIAQKHPGRERLEHMGGIA